MVDVSEYGVTELIVNANPLENPSISLRDPQVWQGIFGGGTTDAGVSVTPTTAMGYPPLWRAINLIAGDAAKLPLNVYRRLPDSGKEVDRRHPAWALLNRRVSVACDSMTFRECLTAHALLRGNGYAAIQRNNRNDPVGLAVLHPSDTYPAIVEGELYYVTHVNSDQIRLRARDVLHIRGLSDDGMVGYDLISLMADALGVGMAAQRFGARFFGQGSNMAGLLLVPHHFDESKIRNTMEAWNEMSSGLSKSHKVALLQDGLKFQQLTIAPEQAQFLQTRQYEVRATVANITGCPPHKLGDDTRTSHSSLEQENQSYLDECLDRWLRKWEIECNQKLLSDTQIANDTHFIEYNRKALLRMSSKDRAEYYAKLQEHGDMTVNDVLRAENMPTIGEKGDRRYRPGNLVEIGEEPDSTAVPPAEPAPPQQPEPPEEAPENRDTLRAFVESSVSRSVEFESSMVTKAAKKEGNFTAWVDQFYSDWIASSSVSDDVKPAFIEHASRSKRELMNVASSTTQTNLAGAVAECVATWSDRGQILTSKLIGENNG
jgi:HK97 family phage portal protein